MTVERRHNSERAISENGPRDEVLVTADARILHTSDRVGDHLSLDVDRQRAVDRHRIGVARDHVLRVDNLDREDRELVVVLQPGVKLSSTNANVVTDTPSNWPCGS